MSLLNLILYILVFFQLFLLCYSAPAWIWSQKSIYQVLIDRFARTPGAPPPSFLPSTAPISVEGCEDINQYCGGTFKGIQSQLDYIQNMGFDALWITPVSENIDPVTTPEGVLISPYHGYATKHLYNINPKFGTKTDLINLVDECHKRNILVMLDVIPNHMGQPKTPELVSEFTPFDKLEYYHPYSNYNPWDDNWNDMAHNQTHLENIWFFGLADLDQSHPFVDKTLKDWVKSMITGFGIDGLRIDTARFVQKDWWPGYVQNADVFSAGEAAGTRQWFPPDNGPYAEGWPYYGLSYSSPYQEVLDGIIDYPLYWMMKDVFLNRLPMYQLSLYWEVHQKSFKNIDNLLNFMENHDQIRWLNDSRCDKNMVKNVMAFIFGIPGIPVIYYGQEQGFSGGPDPFDREPFWPSHYNTSSDLYLFIQKTLTYKQKSKYYLEDFQEIIVKNRLYGWQRGQTVFFITNQKNTTSPLQYNISYAIYTIPLIACLFFKTLFKFR